MTVLTSDFRVYHARIIKEPGVETVVAPKLVLLSEMADVQVVDIASGDRFAAYLSKSGRVYWSGRLLDDHLTLSCHEQRRTCLTSSEQLLVPGIENAARVYATNYDVIVIDRTGVVWFFGYSSRPVRRVPGARFSHILQSTDGGYLMGYRAVEGREVSPALNIAQEIVIDKKQLEFQVQRVNHPIDEGIVDRDLTAYFDDEELNIKWRVPAHLKAMSFDLGYEVLGDATSYEIDETPGQTEGNYTYFSISKPDWGKPPSGRRAMNAAKMEPFLDLANKHCVW